MLADGSHNERGVKYRTIVADPPWPYGSWGTPSNRSKWAVYADREYMRTTPMPYPTMAIDDIKALPVASLADSDCDLYLWTTQRYLPESFAVMACWGFRYAQTLTWCKMPRGTGQGGLFCPTTEFLVLARRGRMPQGKTRLDSTWWQVKRPHNSHSSKPEFFQDLIEGVSDPPRLELFARRQRLGWDVWGNEVESSISLEVPAC